MQTAQQIYLNQIVNQDIRKNSTGLLVLDIGFLTAEFASQTDMENYITRGHINFPLPLPKDGNNQTFSEGILMFRNFNAERHTRDWLVWSQHKQSLFCFPCLLFWNSVCFRLRTESKSALATAEG